MQSTLSRCQAIIRNNAGILLIQTPGTNFSEIVSAIHAYSFTKMHTDKNNDIADSISQTITARGGMPLEADWNYGNYFRNSWWRHQMETFFALLVICAGNSPVTGEFPVQRPVTRSFDVFFYLLLNKRLSKQWWGWWFETQSRPSWRHINEYCKSNS